MANDKAGRAANLPLASELLGRKVAKATNRMLGVKGEGKAANLPMASSLFGYKADLANAVKKLEKAFALKRQLAEITKLYEEAKAEVQGIALAAADDHGPVGYRHGNKAVLVTTQTRTSLSKEALLENGVTAEQIQASMVESDPFYTVRFETLGE